MDIPHFDSQNPEPFCKALARLPISQREQYYARIPVEFLPLSRALVEAKYQNNKDILRDLRLKYPTCRFESNLYRINAFI